MELTEYQTAIESFAVYPRDTEIGALSYLALGLNGEAGEVADLLKKAIRNEGFISDERRERILEEIGDVLWYITRIAIEFDTSMTEIADSNLRKLEKRRESNQLRHE